MIVHDLISDMEVEKVSLSKPPDDVSSDRDIHTTKGNKRKNHRGGRKKKAKMGSKLGDQDTSAKGTDIGIVLYKVKAVEGKGLGVFAVRDLKRGTRIMCERPLIHLLKGNLMDVPVEFSKLTGHEQALYLSLHCRPLDARDAARTNSVRTQEGLRPSAAAPSIEERLKIMAIYETNTFEAGEGSVICAEASRINHSCLPNVHHCWNNSIGRETVHAVKDIAAGEEILTTYIQICRYLAERNKQLSQYGFTCDCPACDESAAFGSASDKRRKRLFQIDQGLAMYSCLPVLSPFDNDRKALGAVLEYIELLREEGIENMESTRWFVGLLYRWND